MTQKRLKEIQAETEFDYEPLNYRLQNRYLYDVKQSKREYSAVYDALIGFAILIAFCAVCAGILLLPTLF